MRLTNGGSPISNGSININIRTWFLVLVSHQTSSKESERYRSGGTMVCVRHHHHRPTLGDDKLMFDFWQFPDVYSQDEIKDINKFLSKNFVDMPDRAAEGVVKTSAVEVVQWGAISTILAKVEHCMLHANKVNFSFDLYLPLDMFQVFNHNTYRIGQEYGWHDDRIIDRNRISDIKLTFILNLSEQSYTGGDLYLRWGSSADARPDDDEEDGKLEFGPGSAILFTGGLYHKVSPVVEGTRKSLTTWIEGPKWK